MNFSKRSNFIAKDNFEKSENFSNKNIISRKASQFTELVLKWLYDQSSITYNETGVLYDSLGETFTTFIKTHFFTRKNNFSKKNNFSTKNNITKKDEYSIS